MDKHDKLPVKMFDGTQFSVWKYHMEIVFEAKKVLKVVSGFGKRPTPTDPTNLTPEELRQIDAWDDKNANARMFISKSISQKILGKLTSCPTAAAMWQKLCSLHLKKTPESVFTLQGKFFDYKMQSTDDISSHIQNITEMAMLLADLDNIVPDKMIISKILYSLPPNYNSIIAAWSNVPEISQTVDNLEERLLRHESLLQRQGSGDTQMDQAFFTRSASASQSRPISKKEQHHKDLNYIRDLKARTKCYNCHELGHWSADCPKPKKKRPNGKDPRKIDGGISDANLIESLRLSSSSDEDSKSLSDEDFAFVITSTVSSYALAAESYTETWFADSGASEHMTDRLDWFSDFQSIPKGVHTVQTADDTKLWVRGKGNIHISCLVDGQYYNGLMRNVLFVPKLKRNLFSVGLVYEKNLSFVTFPG